ncbi:MAG TPA: phosphatidylglycerophosphatase A [Rhodanobacteraceae bacterium]|nr:phosphatidylglycerophosphatase A [Rhodanobacteraceae bacterium]
MKLDAEMRRAVLAHPAGWIASGFGSGLSPIASGTVGSAVAIAPWLVLRHLDVAIYAIVVAVAFVIGIWSADRVIRVLRVEDPGVVVWDEFVGQWIALLPLVVAPRDWPWIVAGFVLFRIFDVWKPWPASWADRSVKGGFGAMLDDAIAGGYAAVVLALLIHSF